MSSTMKYQLFKLNKSNFNVWFYQIKNVFQAESIEFLLDDSQPPINLTINLNQTSSSNSNQDNSNSLNDQSEQLLRLKEIKQGLGKSIIQQSLDHTDINLIINLNTCKEIIDFFRSRSSRSVTKQNLNAEFVNLKWLRNETADDFIAKLTNLQTRMIDAGLGDDESRMVQKLISTIPAFLIDVQQDFERDDAKGVELKYE